MSKEIEKLKEWNNSRDRFTQITWQELDNKLNEFTPQVKVTDEDVVDYIESEFPDTSIDLYYGFITGVKWMRDKLSASSEMDGYEHCTHQFKYAAQDGVDRCVNCNEEIK